LYSTLAQFCALEQCWPRLIKVPVFGFGKQLRQLLKLEAATSEAQQSLQKKIEQNQSVKAHEKNRRRYVLLTPFIWVHSHN
jgi:hypothetical protein